MMIAVQLDKREEFDRLWTFASSVLERENGAGRGYFQSHCDTPTTTEPCDDPYGEQQMVTALIFAHDRWGSTTTIDYETEALELLNVMRHKEDENGGSSTASRTRSTRCRRFRSPFPRTWRRRRASDGPRS